MNQLFIFLSIFYFGVVFTSSDSLKKVCKEMGFNSETLKCSSCDKLAAVVSDLELISECQQCCKEESHTSLLQLQIEKVVFVTCPSILQQLPHLKNFVELHSDDYKSFLKMKYRKWQLPALLLEDEKAKVVETISIDGWKTEDVVAFMDSISKTIQK